MLSIIIASVDNGQLQKITQNIRDTIGVPHEVLGFNNGDGRKGICRIYNEGIAQAKYDLLCFMHEDVFIHTQDWGAIVAGIFNNHNVGVLGIAGASYKSLAPSGWLSLSSVETEYSNLIQSFKYANEPTRHHVKNRGGKKLARVACVDGVWFCVPKKVAASVLFDETTFKGFHCYDADFCLAAGQHHEIAVTFDVLLHHFSEGNFGRVWIQEILKLHNKWESRLPVSTEVFTPKQLYKLEKQSFRYFIKKLVAYDFPASVAYKALNRHERFYKMSTRLYLKIHLYIIKYFFVKPVLGLKAKAAPKVTHVGGQKSKQAL